jgi:membrane-associated phospholipid phosphatase
MKQLIQQHKTFYQSWLIWFILVGLYLSFNSKAAGSLALNEIHTPVGDIFFRYITWGGDGILIGIVCFVFLFVRLRYGILLSLVSFISAFFVSLLKQFYDEPRPSRYFAGQDVNWVDGIDLYANHSFPSGHAAAAFTMFLLMSFFFNNKSLTAVFFILALLVAISRVYLFQHFLIDVWVGSLCGVVFGTILISSHHNYPPIQKQNLAQLVPPKIPKLTPRNFLLAYYINFVQLSGT